jgi:molybdenum cofactor cytidylyltransferase
MSTSLEHVYAVILAAGASTRLGSPKQLLQWRGLSLLEHTIAQANEVLDERVYLVLGAQAELIKNTLHLHTPNTLLNADWHDGMATSIRTGLNALPANAQAVLILLCDQPMITALHLQKILQTWAVAPLEIVASYYQESLGVPAVFPASYFGLLLNLQGDRGAKQVLRQFQEQVISVALPEAEFDVDDQVAVNQLFRS